MTRAQTKRHVYGYAATAETCARVGPHDTHRRLCAPGRVLLISCYELGHQPISLASPLALLRKAGFDAAAVDTTTTPLEDGAIRAAGLVAISVPMHTALRLGTCIAERVRRLNPSAHVSFYGLYASLNGDYLLRHHADSVIGGEYEGALVALAQALDREDGHESDAVGRPVPHVPVPGVHTCEMAATPVLQKLPFALPARDTLPPPHQYAHLVRGERVVPAGYTEASRGCLHTCRHCPITPVYGGRFFIVPRTIVMEDIRQQVRAGVRHITFGDPDFLNGPGHSLAIVRALHAEFPDVTFDATIKVEHILERRALFPELASLGCAFVVSAVESLSDEVLRHLHKGHTRDDFVEALGILRAAGIPMRPTFVAFTPWTSAADYAEVLEIVSAQDIVEHIDAIQYAIRLLVPPGSALLEETDAARWLGELDESAFTYRWTHPDPRMDHLQAEVSVLVECMTASSCGNSEIYDAICALTERVLGLRIARHAGRRAAHEPVPRLSEPWFC